MAKKRKLDGEETSVESSVVSDSSIKNILNAIANDQGEKTVVARAFYVTTKDECDSTLGLLGGLQSRHSQIIAAINEKVREFIKESANELIVLQEEIKRADKAIINYAVQSRDELLKDTTGKTATFPRGQITFQTTPPSVRLGKGVDEEAVIERLHRFEFSDCVRTTEELNREMIGMRWAELASVIGAFVTYGSAGEKVLVKPLQAVK